MPRNPGLGDCPPLGDWGAMMEENFFTKDLTNRCSNVKLQQGLGAAGKKGRARVFWTLSASAEWRTGVL